jgi:hypothetical protein
MITFAEAVEEVLCFSWIDSKQSGGDEATFVLKFSLRNHAVFGLTKLKKLKSSQ